MPDLADNDEYGRFFAEHRAMLEGVAYGMTRDVQLAEDVVANAAIRVWRRFQRQVPERPLGYLFRAVQNEARDQLRRSAATASRERAWPLGSGLVPSFEATVDERDLIERMLPALPEKQRRTVEMRYLEGLPDEVIAERMGVGLVTVRSNAHRALKYLREEMAVAGAAA